MWQKQLIHIIALNIDPETPLLKSGLQEQQLARAKRGRMIAEKLEYLGIENCWQGVLALVDHDENRVGRAHFAQYLVNIGKINPISECTVAYVLDCAVDARADVPSLPQEAQAPLASHRF